MNVSKALLDPLMEDTDGTWLTRSLQIISSYA